MHDKNKDKKFYRMATFLTVLPRARFRTQSNVYGGAFCKNNLLMIVLDGFFFQLEDRIKVVGRVRQGFVLYSNNCEGICLDRLNIGDLCLY